MGFLYMNQAKPSSCIFCSGPDSFCSSSKDPQACALERSRICNQTTTELSIDDKDSIYDFEKIYDVRILQILFPLVLWLFLVASNALWTTGFIPDWGHANAIISL